MGQRCSGGTHVTWVLSLSLSFMGAGRVASLGGLLCGCGTRMNLSSLIENQGRMLPYMSDSIVADSAPAEPPLLLENFQPIDSSLLVQTRKIWISSMVADPEHVPFPAFHPIPTILEAANRKGMVTGLVATSTITHATLGAYGSHVGNHSLEPQMALQMVHNNIDLIMGGGRSNWLPQELCFPMFGELQYSAIEDCRTREKC
jgi:hypothetical protein